MACAGEEACVDIAMSPRGLLVHARRDWPCAVCRPGAPVRRRAYCLCLDCSTAILADAKAGAEDARALLPDVADALSRLGAVRPEDLNAFD